METSRSGATFPRGRRPWDPGRPPRAGRQVGRWERKPIRHSNRERPVLLSAPDDILVQRPKALKKKKMGKGFVDIKCCFRNTA